MDQGQGPSKQSSQEQTETGHGKELETCTPMALLGHGLTGLGWAEISAPRTLTASFIGKYLKTSTA